MKYLDCADVIFNKFSGEKAIVGKSSRFIDVRAIQFFYTFWFTCKIGYGWNGLLHSEGHFLLGYGRLNFRIAYFTKVFLI